MAYTSFCSAWEKEILHSLLILFPCLIVSYRYKMTPTSDDVINNTRQRPRAASVQPRGSKRGPKITGITIRAILFQHAHFSSTATESMHYGIWKSNSLYFELEIQSKPLILMQVDNISHATISSGKYSKVYLGELSQSKTDEII